MRLDGAQRDVLALIPKSQVGGSNPPRSARKAILTRSFELLVTEHDGNRALKHGRVLV